MNDQDQPERKGRLEAEPAGGGKIDLPASAQARGLEDGRVYEIAVKVGRPGYVPEGLTVRARAGDFVLTAQATGAAIKRMESDPLVLSVSISRPLRMIE